MTLNSEKDLAYTAGIIDGEGSISIIKTKRNKKNCSFSLSVTVANNNEFLMSFLKERYGGTVNSSNRWHRTYQWRLCSNQAMAFLMLINNFLFLKREQAILGIQFQQRKNEYTIAHLKKSTFKGGNIIPIEEIKRREVDRNSMHELNFKYRLSRS